MSNPIKESVHNAWEEEWKHTRHRTETETPNWAWNRARKPGQKASPGAPGDIRGFVQRGGGWQEPFRISELAGH